MESNTDHKYLQKLYQREILNLYAEHQPAGTTQIDFAGLNQDLILLRKVAAAEGLGPHHFDQLVSAHLYFVKDQLQVPSVKGMTGKHDTRKKAA